MRQTYDYEDHSGGLPLIYMALAVSAFVLMILVLVVIINKDKGSGSRHTATVSQQTVVEEETEENSYQIVGDLVASDLDFWDMYPVETEETEEVTESNTSKEEAKEEEEKNDPSNGGKNVEVVLRDGTSEWLPINPYWKKNTYDFSNLVSKNDLLHYYS